MAIEPVRNISVFVGCANTFINYSKSKKNVQEINSEDIIECVESDFKDIKSYSSVKTENKKLLKINDSNTYLKNGSVVQSGLKLNQGIEELQPFYENNSGEIILENNDELIDQNFPQISNQSNYIYPRKDEELKYKVINNYSSMWKDLIYKTYHTELKESGTRINLTF
jgi:hypothetical protein